MSQSETAASSLAKRIPPIALALLVILPLSALGTRFGLWPYTVGILLIAISMAGSLLIQIVNALWLMRKPPLATKRCLRRASLYALPPLAIVATVLQNSTSGIVLHDVTTDTQNPPQFSALLEQRGTDSNPTIYSAEKANKQQELYPQLGSLKNSFSQQENFDQALKIATAMGWEIAASDAQSGIIEAVDTTFWFGFKDDIVIRCKALKIDLRSVSRVGESDLGANAKRIQSFLDNFKKASKH